MRKATVETKSNSGVYKVYTMAFKSENHFDNWYHKVNKFGKVIGVTFLDGCGDNWFGYDN